MRWRILLSALLIVVGFGVLSLTYFRGFVQQRTHGIILVIAPGISPDLLRLAELRSAQAGFRWFERSDIRLSLVDATLPPQNQGDYPSLLSYLSTGTVGAPGHLGLDLRGKRLDNLLYAAQRTGRLIGLVTTDRLTSPGIAAFFAHVDEAADQRTIALQLFDSTPINIAMGGGRAVFDRLREMGERDLFEEAQLSGYHIVTTSAELWPIEKWPPPRILGVFAPDTLPSPATRRISTEEEVPSLETMVTGAIERLQYALRGYFLIIENHLIAEACAANRGMDAADEILALDRLMAKIREYAGTRATVILYSPFAQGGFQVLKGAPLDLSTQESMPLYPRLVPPGSSSQPQTPPTPPALAWHNGPGGARISVPLPETPRSKRGSTRKPISDPLPMPDPLQLPLEPAGFYALSAEPSTAPGLVFVSSSRMAPPRALLRLRDLHQLIRDQFQ
ncbi:MAG: hypothetical protein OHK005_05480 [Candidatus Methylacidiphilales bacterium]